MKSKLNKAVEQTQIKWLNLLYRSLNLPLDPICFTTMELWKCGFCAEYRSFDNSKHGCDSCPVFKVENKPCYSRLTGMFTHDQCGGCERVPKDPTQLMAVLIYIEGFNK